MLWPGPTFRRHRPTGQEWHKSKFHAFASRVILESRSFEAALGMVGAGIGVTFVPDTVVRKAIDNKEGRTYASIAEFRPARNILIACKKGRYLSRAASEFIYMAKNMFQAQQPAEGHNKGSGL